MQSQSDEEVVGMFKKAERLLRHHFALVLAAVLGLSHYNGNISWYFYTSSFGVSGFDNQDIYLTISIGFVILVLEIFLFLFVFLLRILAQIAISKFRKLSIQNGLRVWFQKLRAPKDSISFWSAGTYFFVLFIVLTPPLGALGYAEFNRFIVDSDICFRCVTVSFDRTVLSGKVVSSDTERFAIYTTESGVRIVNWDQVDSIRTNSIFD